MATFYKYAERQAGDYVNWAEIGKNATDMITEEYRIRDEKKAAIDEEARQLFLKLAEPPTGESESYSDKAIKFATVAQDQKLNDLRLLKSGRLNLQEYLSRSQNLLDGTGITFNLFKEYQDEYTTKMERINNADPAKRSQMVEQELMASVEGFANLNAMDILVDPNTGKVNLGTKELDKATGIYKFKDVLPVAQARARIKGKYNYFNSDVATTDIEKNLGENINTLRKFGSQTRSGQLTTIADKKELKNYEDAEEKFINSYLSAPLNTSSILTNDMNKGYYPVFTKEAAAKDPKAIYFKTDSNGSVTPEFTDDQKKEAFNYMQTTLRGKIDRKVTADTYNEPTLPQQQQWQYLANQDKKTLLNTTTMLGRLYAAKNGAELKSATDAFNAINPNVKKIVRNKDGVYAEIYDKDGILRNYTIPFYGQDKSLKTQAQFIESAGPLLAGNADYSTAIKNGGYIKGGVFNSAAESTSEFTTQTPTNTTPADPYSAISSRLNQGVKSDIFTKKEDDAASELSSALNGIATVEGVGIVNDVLKVTFNGQTKEFKSDQKLGNATTVANNVKAWVLGEFRKLSPEEQAKIAGSKAP